MEIKPGKYKHFKGEIYIVVNIAKDSENPEKYFVIYHHDRKPDELWVRSLEMFTENVERDGYSGSRFEYIGE
jgi:hypothetical protein